MYVVSISIVRSLPTENPTNWFRDDFESLTHVPCELDFDSFLDSGLSSMHIMLLQSLALALATRRPKQRERDSVGEDSASFVGANIKQRGLLFW